MNPKTNGEIQTLPLLPLRGVVPFPDCVFTLDVGRERSMEAVKEAVKNYDGRIIAVTQRDAQEETPARQDLYTVGTVLAIRQVMPQPDLQMRLLVEGISRATILDVEDFGMYLRGKIVEWDDSCGDSTTEQQACKNMILKNARKLVRKRGLNAAETLSALEAEENPNAFCNSVGYGLLQDVRAKQALLEIFDVDFRLKRTLDQVAREISLANLEEKIQRKVHEAMDRANHDYYLREQIHAIQDELGEDEDEEIAEYRKQLRDSKMPDDAREKVTRELKRLARTAAQSPEASVSQNYIEYMLELPWGVRQKSEIDIARARKVLDEDHYGLREVKDRLLEYLAVRRYTDSLRSPILCLVGPPGVGKTSIAKSIARALNRKFTQVSLGGVHDEAEIRGHRKTYVGAMPGRIIESIQSCKTMNPVFLLDEIDKIARDMRGDPASALLEALDPEQNNHFKDHYIEAPFDLSDVLFITTANSTDPIDRALLDRMEVIEVNSYTLEEKCKIAKQHLVPKQMKAHGLERGKLRISEKVIATIIDGYTREAGVRNLERTIEKLCRKAVLALTEDSARESITIRAADLKTYLGTPKYIRQENAQVSKIGIVNGLAWTSVGGEVMPVEALTLEGKGNLELTGKLGEVMQESAKLARSIVRGCAAEYGVKAEFFDTHDLHIHVPEGAVPKDGPSAGVALTCALLSAVSGIPARNDVAMTGEVTLHGRVLPIGGVREKLLAAYRMGIRRILLPKENEKDLEEIDADIRGGLDIHLIGSVNEAIDLVLEKTEPARAAL